MSHIATVATQLININAEIMAEALERVTARHEGAIFKAVDTSWQVEIPAKTIWRWQNRARLTLVQNQSGQLEFQYDTDYEAVVQQLRAEIVQEYTALALQVALLRTGWTNVQQIASEPGVRSVIKGVRA